MKLSPVSSVSKGTPQKISFPKKHVKVVDPNPRSDLLSKVKIADEEKESFIERVANKVMELIFKLYGIE